MSATGKPDPFRLGFLTALAVPDQGYVGGLLVTNRYGRPLEFQCTAPVKPNRTQELLYGPTLEAFLIGELISRTLIDKAGIKPHLILTERDEILDVREYISVPVARVEIDAPAASDDPETGLPARMKLGRQYIRFHASHREDQAVIQKDAAQVPKDADMREPFQRVREALLETIRASAVVRPAAG